MTKKEKTSNKEPVLADLAARVLSLELCIAKMAHFNGGANQRILSEYDIKPYDLTNKDKTRGRYT
jgi:hypothetical protein